MAQHSNKVPFGSLLARRKLGDLTDGKKIPLGYPVILASKLRSHNARILRPAPEHPEPSICGRAFGAANLRSVKLVV